MGAARPLLSASCVRAATATRKALPRSATANRRLAGQNRRPPWRRGRKVSFADDRGRVGHRPPAAASDAAPADVSPTAGNVWPRTVSGRGEHRRDRDRVAWKPPFHGFSHRCPIRGPGQV